jgi:hypothetical protein
MNKIAILLFVAALSAQPVAASDRTDVTAVLHQWVDGFNKGDSKSALAACADQGAIIDDIAPYEWHGPGMCSKWMDSFNAWVAKDGITEGNATAGKARHINIDGAQAYAVLPMTLSWKQHGNPIKETGAIWTVSLAKGDLGWRITGWSWAHGTDFTATGKQSGH